MAEIAAHAVGAALSQSARETGFTPIRATIEVEGICGACAARGSVDARWFPRLDWRLPAIGELDLDRTSTPEQDAWIERVLGFALDRDDDAVPGLAGLPEDVAELSPQGTAFAAAAEAGFAFCEECPPEGRA